MGSMTERAASYLVDTNVLLRLAQPDSPEHKSIQQCAEILWAQGAELFYTSQNLAGFGMFAHDLQTGMDSGFQSPKQTNVRA
jgi:predicted nucleic acid-binding protein